MGLALIALKCNTPKKMNARLTVNTTAKKPNQTDTLRFSLKIPQSFSVDSIHYQLGNQKISSPLALQKVPLGQHQITATAFAEGKSHTFSKSFWVYAPEKPKLYKYKIVNQFPHDPNAYTQGLEFDGDVLYESTGLNGRSTVRKVDFTTGTVLKEQKLDQVYFGEGLTLLDDRVVQLTWKANLGFVYDKETLQMQTSFAFGKSKEGWGLCHNNDYLFKSDGTHILYKLDPENYQEVAELQVMTPTNPVNKINELEWVDGLIYANTYQFQKDVAVVIQPETGAVAGVINFSGLREKLKNNPKAEVLNGIAYHPERKTFFVTGKLWNTLFEVAIYEE